MAIFRDPRGRIPFYSKWEWGSKDVGLFQKFPKKIAPQSKVNIILWLLDKVYAQLLTLG
jgi:hypothetical protein